MHVSKMAKWHGPLPRRRICFWAGFETRPRTISSRVIAINNFGPMAISIGGDLPPLFPKQDFVELLQIKNSLASHRVRSADPFLRNQPYTIGSQVLSFQMKSLPILSISSITQAGSLKTNIQKTSIMHKTELMRVR